MFARLLRFWLVSLCIVFPLEASISTTEKRCYTVDFTIYLSTPTGTNITAADARSQLQAAAKLMEMVMPLDSRCWHVSLSLGHVVVNSGSPASIIGATFIFNADRKVTSSQVASKVSGCITAVRGHQGTLSQMVTVNIGGVSVPISRITISDKKSCCGQTPPPCIVTSNLNLPISTSSPIYLSSQSAVTGNLWYEVRRCYKVKASLFYNIPGGVALTEYDVRQKLDPAIKATEQMLPLLGSCNGVSLSVAKIFVPPPHVTLVEIAATLVLTADSRVPDASVNSRLTGCLSTLNSFQGLLTSNAPSINVKGKAYPASSSRISSAESCCSPKPPPCKVHMGSAQTAGPELFTSRSVHVSSNIKSITTNVMQATWLRSSTESTTSNIVQATRSSSSSFAVPMAMTVVGTTRSVLVTTVTSQVATTVETFTSTPTTQAITISSVLTATPSPGNLWYEVRRCYKVKASLFYNIPGGVALTEYDVRQKLDPAIKATEQMLPLLGSCNGVSLSVAKIFVPPPHVTLVEIAATLVLTADSRVPNASVNSRLTGCLSTLNSFQGLLTRNAPSINVKGKAYPASSSRISSAESCCSPKPPPCKVHIGPAQTAGSELFTSSSVHVTSSIKPTTTNLGQATQLRSSSTESTTTDIGQASQSSSSPFAVPKAMTVVGTSRSVLVTTVTSQVATTLKTSTSPPTTQAITTSSVLTATPLPDTELRCYNVQVVLTLQTSGPVNLTLDDVKTQVQSTLGSVGGMLFMIPSCRDVSLTLGNISLFPPKHRIVAVGATLTFSADKKVPRDSVASRVSGCMTAVRGFKSFLTANMATIVVKGLLYKIQNIDILGNNSCCGNVAPPCFLSDQIEIVNFPKIVSVDSGKDLLTHCRIKYPSSRVKITWKRGVKEVPADDSQRRRVKDGSLMIKDISTKDAGIYTCVATGPLESVTRQVTVQVLFSERLEMTLTLSKEKYDTNLANKSSQRYMKLAARVKEEIEEKLKAEVVGFERVQIIGFREGSVLVDFLVIITQTIDKPSDEPLDIRKEVERSMVNQVRSGTFGKLSVLPDSLVLKVKPPPPTGIAVKDTKTQEVRLEWSPPENHETYKIDSYVIKYHRVITPHDPQNKSVPGSRRTLVLKELEQETEYEIRMCSRNMKGEGTLSEAIRVTTQQRDKDDKNVLLLKILLPVVAGILLLLVVILFVCWRRKSSNKKDNGDSSDKRETNARKELSFPNPTYDQSKSSVNERHPLDAKETNAENVC